MLSIRTILHPTDFSDYAANAFKLACSLAQAHDAQLVVLYVVPLEAVMYGPPTENCLAHLREELRRMKPSDPKTRVQHLLIEGNPTTTILRVAREINCDLIVMGTHGRMGLDLLLMGSVAEQVVRRATCSVLTVKTPPRSMLSSEEFVTAEAGKMA